MNKYYDLNAVINGEFHQFSKHFSSRDAAIEFIFNYFQRVECKNVCLEDEYQLSDKHNIEYVIDHYNRFRIARVCY